ncbi:MAG: serine/threonine-protein phosphatase, partial [Calditrichaeota bacterium]|nr:serine/threonine-protein phosphatase [Calditrichota bacterium]
TYCNAGHNAPILLRKDGSTVMLKEGGTVLGFLENRTFHQNTVDFRPGDTLVCFTDGVTETMDVHEEEFGDERLMQTLKTNLGEQPKTLKIAILDDMRTFAGDCEFPDDVTLLIARLDD